MDLSKRFSKGEVQKSYLVLVIGKPDPIEGIIEVPIAADRRNPGRMKVDFGKGRQSRTDFKVIEAFKRYFLLEVRPKTGRQHQIRVHLQYLGSPLAVDPWYGGGSGVFLSHLKRNYKQSKDPEKPLIDRLTLHSSGLRFFHFRRRENLELTAPLPRDFEILLKYLRKFSLSQI